MTSLRLLCMGDNHGHLESLQTVVEETENEEFDFIIHVGDITNTCLDGMDAGENQLREIIPLFEKLSERGELVYVWGNRDFEVCMKGMGTRIDDYADFEVEPGTHIPTAGTVEVAGQEFTQDPSEVTDETILVTHYYLSELLDHFSGRAYFSGHVHTGRHKHNVLNTAFLYRGGEHGGKPLEGGYFIVEIEDGQMDVTLHSLGGLKRGSCPEHLARGIQFAPSHWRNACTFCYEEDDFYTEILESAQYELESSNRDVTVSNLRSVSLELYQGSGTPRDFEEKLSTHAEEYTKSS